MVSDPKFWLGFSLVPTIGPKRITDLRSAFGNLAVAWNATERQLQEAGLEEQPLNNLLRVRQKIDLAAEMEKISKAGAWLVTLDDERYPAALKTISDAPPVLYVRGTLLPTDQFALGIVGTRKATRYGLDVTYDLSKQLARQGIAVVSGLAHGIDSAAHRGSLDGGHRTLAVLGCGIENIYPHTNRELAQRIMRNGAIISEFPIGTPPEGRNFPRRNRIISGLSLGVLIVEAPESSGAIITANTAAEQGREVFAIPGNIYSPASKGTNRLIQEGAKLVTGVEDILEELNISFERVETRKRTEQIVPADPTEALLLKHLSFDPLHVDDLVRLCGLPTSTVSSTLTILELKGLAQMVGNMQYSLTHK